jgi:SAM-dependent methyltransferase
VTFFGELYLRSTEPYLSSRVTEREVDYLSVHLIAKLAAGAVLDIGCGTGRHASALATRFSDRRFIGVERDAYTRQRALSGFEMVKGDWRALPFEDGAFAGAYAFYSSLFCVDSPTDIPSFAEAARVISRGGLLCFQTVPLTRLAHSPKAEFRSTLPDGSTIEEKSNFDARTGVDSGHRTFYSADGRKLSADFYIRYFSVEALTEMLEEAGFRIEWVHGDLNGSTLRDDSTELLVGARRD